jgi:hypothetical protein
MQTEPGLSTASGLGMVLTWSLQPARLGQGIRDSLADRLHRAALFTCEDVG